MVKIEFLWNLFLLCLVLEVFIDFFLYPFRLLKKYKKPILLLLSSFFIYCVSKHLYYYFKDIKTGEI